MTVSNFVSRDPNLLNCPCCGAIAAFVHQDGDTSKDYGQIYCMDPNCFICTPYGTYEKCKAIWNRRAEFAKQLMEWF